VGSLIASYSFELDVPPQVIEGPLTGTVDADALTGAVIADTLTGTLGPGTPDYLRDEFGEPVLDELGGFIWVAAAAITLTGTITDAALTGTITTELIEGTTACQP